MPPKKPKYALIASSIARDICAGRLKPGAKVPSESALMRQWGVSNTTARKIHLELELRGVVRRTKGKGTVVLENPKKYITRKVGLFEVIKDSFSQNLIKDGFSPRVEIAERKMFRGSESVEIDGNFFEIRGKIFKIRTLRYANSVLFKDETLFIDAGMCAGIEDAGDLDPVLVSLSDKFSVEIDSVSRSFGACLSDTGRTPFFKSKKPLPLVFLEGANRTKSGKTVVIEKSFYRGDKYRFSVESSS